MQPFPGPRTSPIRATTPLAGLAALTLLVPTLSRAQQAPAELEARIARVENGVLAAVQIEGRAPRVYSIAERMAHYGVPGVSVAVVNEGQVEWARGYGVAEAGTDRKVDARTLFQAASISKPVAALAALRLVDEGLLALDEPVDRWLTSWSVPSHDWAGREDVTLRRLVTHSAGLTVHGFPGYGADDVVPTTVQVLEGSGNTDPIHVDIEPGTRWRYSGGGYTVMQLLVEDVSGKPFPDLLRETVLLPLGMRESAYDQPLSPARAAHAATAHEGDGRHVSGKYHTYPEMAAAGLWTTPSDLCRYIVGTQESLAGEWNPVISKETTEAMLTPGMNGWGLGPALQGEGETLRFSHGGSNEGFRAFFVGYAHTGQGAAVMTNSDNGGMLAREIVQGIAREYGWEDYEPRTITVIDVDPENLSDYVGRYRFEEADVEFSVEVRDDRVLARQEGEETELVPTDEDVFLSLDEGFRIQFQRDEDGTVTGATLPGLGEAKRVR